MKVKKIFKIAYMNLLKAVSFNSILAIIIATKLFPITFLMKLLTQMFSISYQNWAPFYKSISQAINNVEYLFDFMLLIDF